MSECTPRRIASLQPSATVILSSVGEFERVVACTKYCTDVVPEIASHPRTILADSWTAEARQILAAKPDLVIAAVPYQEKAIVEILKAGVRFLGLAPRTLADIYGDIALISGAVDASDRGDAVIREMQNRITEVQQRVHRRAGRTSRPRVFCEEWGKPLIASQPWVRELVEAAGGQFVGPPGKQISPQDVARLNPDVLVAAWCGAGDRVPLEKIVSERDWQATPAARENRVYCIRDEYLNTPAPTLLKGLDALAWAIQPELFPRTKGVRRITFVPASTGIQVGR